MEFLFTIHFTYYAATCLSSILLLYFCLLRLNRKAKAERSPPQPSGSWPLIGHLHLLGKLPHLSLGKLADQYGPLFMIKLGVRKALVVSNAKMVKECLGAGDKVFINRQQNIFVEHLTYNSAMLGFSPYGAYWRQIRKIVTLELLSNQRLEMLKQVRISEVRSTIKAIHDNLVVKGKGFANSGHELVDMKQLFNDINMNTMVRLIAGKSLKEFYQGQEYDRCQKALRDFFDLAGAFVPADALPYFRWLDVGGYEKTMKNVKKDIDHVAQKWLDEHRRRASEDATEQGDFMDVMLSIFESGSSDAPSQFDADTVIKATSMAMILAGSDTTAVTLTWALSLLLNNRNALKKAQDEIDACVGRERQVDESDLKKLVYLQAILKETLRLYPAAPLSVPRVASTDGMVSGYHIPASTQLFINLYKIHRDPQVWEDPLEFHPERFLTKHKDYDVRGQNFELMPFGTGRRICPGISFALQVMPLTLASLLQGFDITTPEDGPVDMTEGFGLTNLKTSPLEVVLMPRLPDYLY